MAKENYPLPSYAKGHFGGNDIYPETTNFGYVDKWADRWPDKEAYVFRPSETDREAITYGELKTATENLVVWLKRKFELKKGDRVGILSVNRLRYTLCDLALSRLGVVSVRIYATMDSKSELTRYLRETDCRVFLCQQASLAALEKIFPLSGHDSRERIVCEDLPRLEHVVCLTGEESPGTSPLPDWRQISVSDDERRQLYQIQSTIKLTDDCSIYSTSGSTGIPKFIVHSQAGSMSFPPGIIRRSGITADDRYFADRPLAHLGGNAMSVITVGATMVIANPWKTLASNPCTYLMTIIKEERINCGMFFPYLLYDIVKSGDASREIRCCNPRFFIFGGQLVNLEILTVVKEKLGAPLVNAYGSTEVGEVACSWSTDSLQVLSKYCGQVLPGTEVKIVNPETREVLPRGEAGSIGIRSRHGWYYLNNEDRMRQSHDEEEFFYPGDVARMSDNGYIEILGRLDDQISVGTLKVYPGPIETMICKHPAVDKAIVFGVPDERLYEVIGAAVLPKPGVKLSGEEIIKFFHDSVNQADLSTGLDMAPKYVWVEQSLPLTSSGKMDKKSIRSKCLNLLEVNSK